MDIKNSKITVIGGGTGTFSVLSGLKEYTDNITAIVSMADSGGSAKKERDEWGLLPSSDIRKSLIALSDVSSENSLLLRKLFSYRYSEGRGLKGITFGNLFLVALTKLLGSQVEAIEKAGEILQIKGKVLPVSMEKVDLVAYYDDGTHVRGEHFIDTPKKEIKAKILSLKTIPRAKITPQAESAIENSDIIIIGPGSFYTTIVANLVVDGVKRALINSKAKIIYILNLMTEYGQTYNYTALDFIKALEKYIGPKVINFVVMNNSRIRDEMLAKYKRNKTKEIINNLSKNSGFKIIEDDIVSDTIIVKEKGDKLKRSFIRHDSEKIAKLCKRIINSV